MSATPEPEVRVTAVTTGSPEVQLLACVLCGVLLWDIDAHFTHAHRGGSDCGHPNHGGDGHECGPFTVSPLVSPRTTPADETAEHEVVVEAEEGSLRSTRFICNAPADAMCHAVWSCDCEGWFEDGVRNGIPAHQPDGDDPDAWHAGRFDPTFCNLREWFGESDEALDGGEVRIPVVATWHGDYYTFALAASPADADTAEREKLRDLIESFVDPDPCWFDHHGGCQAHGYISLEPGEKCPHAEAKEWLAASAPVAATSEERDRG